MAKHVNTVIFSAPSRACASKVTRAIIALMADAAKADGVEHCCRVPRGSSEHRQDCWRLNGNWNNPDE